MKRTWLLLALFSACADDVDPPPTPIERHCDDPGHACTFLGLPGQIGFTKDGLQPTETMVYWTMDTLFASDGTVWFLDWNNHLLRRVMQDGQVVSVVGWNDPVFPGDGNLEDPTAERSADGSIGTDVQLNHPTDIAELATGEILLMSWHNHKLRKIDPATGRVHIIAGSGPGATGDNGPASAATFKQPSRLAVDEAQNIYILDQQNHKIRRIDGTTQIMTTIAGTGMPGFAGDDGPAALAQLSFAFGSNPEPSGGIAVGGGMLYISDSENNRIRRIDLASGMITTIAGTGEAGFEDGPTTTARVNHPRDIELGPDGNLYFADTENNRIRMIDLVANTVQTVAGTGEAGLDETDDRLALETLLHRPFGLDFDPAGNLYISDSLNSRILRVAR